MKELFKKLRLKFATSKKGLSHIKELEKIWDGIEYSDDEYSKDEENLAFPTPTFLKSGEYACFSDGSCKGNPGPGGTGVLIQDFKGDVIWKSAKYFDDTTNNRMELTAAILGMEFLLKFSGSIIYLISDSKYLLDGLTWMQNWKTRGWLKKDNTKPLNLDLWQRIDVLTSSFKEVKPIWVEGHVGHPQNEYCDHLATMVINKK